MPPKTLVHKIPIQPLPTITMSPPAPKTKQKLELPRIGRSNSKASEKSGKPSPKHMASPKGRQYRPKLKNTEARYSFKRKRSPPVLPQPMQNMHHLGPVTDFSYHSNVRQMPMKNKDWFSPKRRYLGNSFESK